MPTQTQQVNPYLSGLVEQRSQLAATLQHLVDLPGDRGTDLSADELAQARQLQTDIAGIDERITVFADAQRSNDQHQHLMATVAQTREQRARDDEQQRLSADSLGARFVGSPEFREYAGRGNSARYEDTAAAAVPEQRAPTLLANLQVPKDRVIVNEPAQRFPLFGVVNRETVSGSAFEYVVSTLTNNAAVVAEGTAKPESPYAETLVPGTLDMVAHWTQISRQGLEDSARVRSVIDGKLTLGVQRKVHDSIAAAILAATVPTAVNANLLQAIRIAVGKVQDAGWNPNAVLLNPTDWASLDIGMLSLVAGQGTAPSVSRSYWGMEVVASSLVPAGTAYVLDGTEAATLFTRSGISVYVSDSHASTFTSNIFTILAEQRAKAVVTNTSAVCKTSATLTREGEEASDSGSGAGGTSAPSTAKR